MRELRKRSQLSQDEFAAALGYSRNYISQIELGNRDPGPRFARDLITFEQTHFGSRVAETEPSSPRRVLADAIKKRGLSTAQLAKLIRYDSGVIEQVVHGTARASEKMIEAICRELPELSKEELMSGSDMPQILGEIHGTHGANPRIVLPPGVKGRMVPLITMAQAGAWDANHTDDYYAHESVFALNLDDRRAFAVRIVGNSMEPRMFEGDVVICSPSAELNNGDCAVVRTKSEQAFIKFWKRHGERVTLESANPDFPPIQFPVAEIAGAWPVIQRIESGKVKKQL